MDSLKKSKSRIREAMWYLSFGVWLISPSRVISGSFHFPVNNVILFFLMIKWHPIQYIHTTFLYPFIYWWGPMPILYRGWNSVTSASFLGHVLKHVGRDCAGSCSPQAPFLYGQATEWFISCLNKGWEDCSVSEVLTKRIWRPAFRFQHP